MTARRAERFLFAAGRLVRDLFSVTAHAGLARGGALLDAQRLLPGASNVLLDPANLVLLIAPLAPLTSTVSQLSLDIA